VKARTDRFTADEFYSLPSPPEGGKQELVRGEVVTMVPASADHGESAVSLASALRSFVRGHGLGRVMVETGYVLEQNPDLVRAPDVSFLAAEDIPPGGLPRRGFVPGPPTLAVEIVSPNDTEAEFRGKVAEYLDAGARRAWIVRTDRRTVSVHRPARTTLTLEAGDTLDSDHAGFAVPGFALAVSRVFDP